MKTLGFEVIEPGVLSLLQDQGRFGYAHLGMTTGGPVDTEAYHWNRVLLDNPPNPTLIEVSLGGLVLEAQIDTQICVTGAPMPLTINDETRTLWCTHSVKPGDRIRLGYADSGVRAYLGVKGGFKILPQFGSTATVVREGIGGLKGKALQRGDSLPAQVTMSSRHAKLLEQDIPGYSRNIRLRTLLGYQHRDFSREQKRVLFSSEFTVSKQWDRMGYRLQGQQNGKELVHGQTDLLSEAIALGAIQIPPDGQPIVMLNDRQTLGGYPKIGAVLSLDCGQLGQCGEGARVCFEPITRGRAQRLLAWHKARVARVKPVYFD